MSYYVKLEPEKGHTYVPIEPVLQDKLLNSYKFPIEKDVKWLDRKYPNLKPLQKIPPTVELLEE